MHITSMPVILLHKLIFDYTHHTKAIIPNGRPDFVDVLADFDYDKPEDSEREKVEAFIWYAIANREFLLQKEVVFLLHHAENGVILPSLEKYMEDAFLETVTKAVIQNAFKWYDGYKGKMLTGEKLSIWDNAHYIDVATQINYFFECMQDESLYLCDDSLMTVLAAGIDTKFFAQLFAFAQQQSSFNVSNLETTTEEITSFCSKIEVSAQQIRDDLRGKELYKYVKDIDQRTCEIDNVG